jgi:hypothetical protein
MSKKNFTGGLNTLLGENPEPETKPGRPKSSAKEITKTSQEGTKDKETRATFIVNEDQLEKLKSIAYWDRLLIKDVVAQALEEYLTRYEKKNGAIKQAPAK